MLLYMYYRELLCLACHMRRRIHCMSYEEADTCYFICTIESYYALCVI